MNTLDILALRNMGNSDLTGFTSSRLGGYFDASYCVFAGLARVLPSRKFSDHVGVEVFPASDSSSGTMFSENDGSFTLSRELSQCLFMAVVAFGTGDDDEIRFREMFEV